MPKRGIGSRAGAGDAITPAPVVAGTVAQLDQLAGLSAADRANPNKLAGDALRELAHRRGIARSTLDGMPDDKVRMQIRYIDAREYEG